MLRIIKLKVQSVSEVMYALKIKILSNLEQSISLPLLHKFNRMLHRSSLLILIIVMNTITTAKQQTGEAII